MKTLKLIPETAGPSIYVNTVDIGREKLKVTEEIDAINKQIQNLQSQLFSKEEYLRRLSSHPYWCFQHQIEVKLRRLFSWSLTPPSPPSND